MTLSPSKGDLDEKRELAEGAKPWLEEKALGAAVLRARKDWFDQMMRPDMTTDGILKIRAQIMALEAVAQNLTVFVNDYKVALKRKDG